MTYTQPEWEKKFGFEPAMTPDKRVEEIVNAFGEVSCILVEEKEIEGLGMSRTYTGGATEEQKDWLRTTLTQYHQDLMSEVVEEAIHLSDDAERGHETEFNEWRAFKGFRNRLRDWATRHGLSTKE